MCDPVDALLDLEHEGVLNTFAPFHVLCPMSMCGGIVLATRAIVVP